MIMRVIFVLSMLLLAARQSPRESEFEQLTKRAEAAGNDTNQSTARENLKKDFESWAQKYNVKPIEQRAPKLLGFPAPDKPLACDWFVRLEQNGKSGGCFAKRELLTFENGEAKRACYYDCYYP